MTSIRLRILTAVMWIVVIGAILVLSYNYVSFINDRIEEEGAQTLSEVYNQINNNFDAYIERNWKNLDDWYSYFSTIESDQEIRDFIESRKEMWGFSQFFFINSDEKYQTAAGDSGTFNMGDELPHLFTERHRIMHSENLGNGTVTLFAFPVTPSSYAGFDYSAIGITYTNEDMVASLDTKAFGGQSSCFIVRPNGEVVLSTQIDESIYGNYLSYLSSASDLSEQEINNLESAWTKGSTGFVSFTLGDKPTYIYYAPINYRKFTMLGVVPQSAANGSMLEIQHATINFAIIVALILVVVLVSQFFLRYRKSSRLANAAIRTRDSLFSILSANVNDVFILLDGQNWHVDYVSPNISRLLGISAEEVSKDIRQLFKCRVDKVNMFGREELEKLKPNEAILREEPQINLKTGEQRWFVETVYREKINGRVKYVVVMSDRTDERKMNESLQEALETAKSANRAKSFFLSNMSHDIRTPMNAIIGFTDLISANVGDKEKVDEYARKITSASKHLLSLINDVLDMSKIESGKTTLNMMQFSMLDLKDELYNIIAPQAQTKDQNLEFAIEGEIPQFVVGDKLRVVQILLNLLSNAVKYTQIGGNIKFIICSKHSNTPNFENLSFIVADNGSGMTEEFLENIFEPFTRETSSLTNKVQGTGLGMAITKNLVDLMGGVIAIDSTSGKGTTVMVDLTFALPDIVLGSENISKDVRSVTQIESSEKALEIPEDALKGLRILAAEDNALSAEMLYDTLDLEGAIIDICENGKIAYERFLDAKSGSYDLILMDVQMPEMGGYEATRNIRNSNHPQAQTIPIFAMTANVFAEDVKEAMDAGMTEHLPKPIDIERLKFLVWQLKKSMEE